MFSILQDWDRPQNIPDPDAKKPDDWDDEIDGEWEPPMIDNPEYKVGGETCKQDVLFFLLLPGCLFVLASLPSKLIFLTVRLSAQFMSICII